MKIANDMNYRWTMIVALLIFWGCHNQVHGEMVELSKVSFHDEIREIIITDANKDGIREVLVLHNQREQLDMLSIIEADKQRGFVSKLILQESNYILLLKHIDFDESLLIQKVPRRSLNDSQFFKLIYKDNNYLPVKFSINDVLIDWPNEDYIASGSFERSGGRVCLDSLKRFISGKLPVHAATCF